MIIIGRSLICGVAALATALAWPVEAQVTHAVTGRVVDTHGVGIEKVEIRFYTEDGLNELIPSSTCESATGGSYSCDVEPGLYNVGAFPSADPWYAISFYNDSLPNAPGYEQILVNGPIDGIDFSLVTGGRVRVQVLTAEGEIPEFPVATAIFDNVNNGVWWETVDHATGVYESVALPSATYFLLFTVFDDSYLRGQMYCGTDNWDFAERFDISAGQVVELPECRLITEKPTAITSGQVTDEQQQPIEGVLIHALATRNEEVSVAMTGADGNYELKVPVGFWKVQATPPESMYFEDQYFPGTPLWDQAQWVAGEMADVDFVLGVGGRVRFRLRAEDGTPPGFKCPIAIRDFDDPTTPVVAESFADETGLFLSPAIPAGKYVFELNPPEGSGYLRSQGYCDRYDWQGGHRVEVANHLLTELDSCALIADRYEPATSSGYLFAYEHEWIINSADYPSFGTSSTAAGDLNNDGLIDIVTSSIDGVSSTLGDVAFPEDFVVVLINQGRNSFRDARADWVPGYYAGGGRDIELADVDCDGYLDLVQGCSGVEWSDGTLWGEQDKIWRNVNGESFEDRTLDWMPPDDPAQYGYEDSLQAWFTHALAVGDLDGDGDVDILRGTPEPVLLNDGTGKMEIAPPSQAADGVVSQEWMQAQVGLDLGDLNRDGVLDVFATGYQNADLHFVALGNGDGTFIQVPENLSPHVFEAAEGYQPILHDFTGDGLLDVFVANIHYGGIDDSYTSTNTGYAPFDQFLIVEGIRDGVPEFRDETAKIRQSHDFNKSWHATAGDLDNDGDLDVLVSNLSFGCDRYDSPEVRMLMNDGKGNMEALGAHTLPPIVGSPTQVVTFDSDLDGDLDMFLANGFSPPILLVNLLLEKHDLNGDGYVGVDDAAAVLAQFETSGESQREDLNGDGLVDAKDLSLILRFQTSVRADNSTLQPLCTKRIDGADK